jgi:hypothetical protein
MGCVSTTSTATLSDLLRNPRDVIARLEQGDVTLTRRDGEALMLTKAARNSENQDALDHLSRLIAASLDDVVCARIAEHLKDEHSWLALLPEQQQFRFVGDYFRILRASLSAGGYTQLATFLASWRGTAEVYALGLTPAEFDADYAEASGPVTRPVDE